MASKNCYDKTLYSQGHMLNYYLLKTTVNEYIITFSLSNEPKKINNYSTASTNYNKLNKLLL